MPNRSWGGVLDYNRYLSAILKPWIDSNYRTRPEPEHTSIVGASFGGLAAFHLALVSPANFGAAYCLSPSLWCGHDMVIIDVPFVHSKLFRMYDGVLSSPDYMQPRIYLDWGLSQDGDAQVRTLEELTAMRCREAVEILATKYHFTIDKTIIGVEEADGAHTEASWAKRFSKILSRFFQRE
jgi:pimeloyl-ACP methyl ester carboxylesterase